MKIGILTFWKTEDNYGQLLQCYATQTFLQSLGHDTFLIKATNGKEYNPNLKQQVISKLRTAYRLRLYPVYLIKRGLKSIFYTLTHGKLKRNIPNRDFEMFRQKHLNCTDKEYTLEMLKENPPEADAYLVGSDQIWNTTDGIFFLSWAKDDVIKASIAASFGARTSTPDFCHLIAPWLKRFNLITVREQNGLEICKEAGVNGVIQVPDPTLMLTAWDYEKIASDNPLSIPYLFVYFLGTRTDICWKEINKFAKDNNLNIVYVGSQGQEDKYPKQELSIEQWLCMIKNASYVLTNSFHGTVFAIQFRKKFMVYPVTGTAAKMNDRLTTLLTPLNLLGRIYDDGLQNLIEEIEYDSILNQLRETAEASKKLFAKIFR